MKKLAFLGIVLLAAFLLVFLFCCRDLRLARRAAEDLLAGVEQGEVPADSTASVQAWAEALQEFGLPQMEIASLRPVSFGKAKATITLQAGEETTSIALGLDKQQGRWRVAQAPESALAAVFEAGRPRLTLKIERQAVMTRELVPLGKDKLLTVQADRWEWLQHGWLENLPWFTAFIGGEQSSLLVGMANVELYGWGGGVAAAAAVEPFVPELIRVNISTTGHESVYHSQVQIRSPKGWRVSEAVTGQSRQLAAGAVIIEPAAEGIKLSGDWGQSISGNRLIFSPADESSPLILASIARSGSAPAYFGSLEVALLDGGLVIVNELPLEQYLCYVVPSEMPAYFGPAAMEVQAIAARTYAVSNILTSHWQSTSAHVVDSVLSQVYNNSGANPIATAAVMATRGTIIAAENKPADIRYFSTSCGYTANFHEVWPGKLMGWLVSRPQFPGPARDVSDEESFRDFINNPPVEAYDDGSAWFRWQFSVPASQMADMIAANLKGIFAANPDVLQRQDGGKFVAVTEMPAEPLGELLDIVPVRRGAGGILIEIEVQGSLGAWRVSREYYIRQLLRPGGGQKPISLLRHDGSRMQDLALLPSAFVYWEKEWEGNTLQLQFRGGGYGHGVGMSQYGARELAARGWTAAAIIGHFFPGAELDYIYD